MKMKIQQMVLSMPKCLNNVCLNWAMCSLKSRISKTLFTHSQICHNDLVQLKKHKMLFLVVLCHQIWPSNNNAKPTCTTSQTDSKFSTWALPKTKMKKHCIQRMILKKAKIFWIIHHLSWIIKKENSQLWRKLITNPCFKRIQLLHTFPKQSSKSTWLKKCLDHRWSLYLIQ